MLRNIWRMEEAERANTTGRSESPVIISERGRDQSRITRVKPRSALLSDHTHIILLSLDDTWSVESWTNSCGR